MKCIDQRVNVQERGVNMVPGMGNMTYEEKLVKLDISKLVERRFRGDMIETHKIITNKGGLNSSADILCKYANNSLLVCILYPYLCIYNTHLPICCDYHKGYVICTFIHIISKFHFT